MILFAIAIVLLIIGLICLAPRESRPGGVALLAIGLVLLFLSTLFTVGTRSVGVVTSFGAPTGRTVDNGIHMKAPWQNVTDIDAAYSTQKFMEEREFYGKKGTSALNCIEVKISDGSIACVKVVVRTRVDEDHADDVFVDYRKSDTDINDEVNDALVRTTLTSAVATVFGKFQPILAAGPDKQPVTNVPDLQSYSKQMKAEMLDLLRDQSSDEGTDVDVKTITVSGLLISKATQKRIDRLQAEVGETRIAVQQQATATARATANNNLAASLAKNPNVLVDKCFDALAERTDKGLSLPAGFSCWPGGGSGVVLPAAK